MLLTGKMPRSPITAVPLIFASLVTAHAQTISFRAPRQILQSYKANTFSDCNTCVVTADFNGDGKPDLLYVFTTLYSTPGVLLGNGDGTFRPAPDISLPTVSPFGRPLTGDFDGDGKQDFLLSGERTWYYRGHGDGSFDAPTEINACAATTAYSFGIAIAGDWNGDGKSDLICSSIVLLSNGDGTFRPAGTVNGFPILTGDFNGDGKPDLLVTAPDNSLRIALGKGDGTFLAAMPPIASLKLGWTGCLGCIVNRPPVLAADFNGDGRLDLVAPSQDGASVLILPGLGDGNFGPPIATQGLPGPITAAADFNRDGKLDVVAGDAILAGNGDGTFQFPVFFGVVTLPCNTQKYVFGCSYEHMLSVVADFNGDNLPDLVTASLVQFLLGSRPETLDLLLNNTPGQGLTSTGVSSATWKWPVAPGSFVSLFGHGLAPVSTGALESPAPTILGGVRVHVHDRSQTNDTHAHLLYVSPTQINLVLPFVTEFAYIDIEQVGTPFDAYSNAMGVPVSPIAPGLFTADGSLAAANAIFIGPNGAQTVVPVTTCDRTGCAPVPIDLSGDPVYLSLYGTGFAQALTASTNCQIGTHKLAVSYAGAQMQTPGLDQINVLLPVTLAGAGTASISCTFTSNPYFFVTSNSVSIRIR